MARHPSTANRTRVALISAILVGPMIFGCGLLSTVNQNLAQTCYDGDCLAYTTWGQNIDTRIDQMGVGCAYAILNNGLLVASNTFGTTRTAEDTKPSAPPAMTLNTRSNAASVTKTMTAIAALKLLAAKNVSVTSSIAPYLPQSWQSDLGQGVSAITFAQLLTHTSGLRDPQGLADTYTNLHTILAQDIVPANKVKKYLNANFALFRILIPYLDGFTDSGVQDIATATAQEYLTYMNSVYAPDIPIACTPASNAVWSYTYPPGATKGTNWGDWTDKCGGGGLQLSVNNMGAFMAHLMLGLYLPKSSNNANEVTLPIMVNMMYGWDYQWNTKGGTCVGKNGDLPNGNNKIILTTLYIYCPATGLGFVGLANSNLPVMPNPKYGFSGTLDDIVYQAYNASWKPQT